MTDRYKDSIIPIEELKRREAETDLLNLDHRITIKNKPVKTFGELKKYVTSSKMVYRLEPFLSDANYSYIHKWFFHKERGLVY
jgi:hypothetical protein